MRKTYRLVSFEAEERDDGDIFARVDVVSPHAEDPLQDQVEFRISRFLLSRLIREAVPAEDLGTLLERWLVRQRVKDREQEGEIPTPPKVAEREHALLTHSPTPWRRTALGDIEDAEGRIIMRTSGEDVGARWANAAIAVAALPMYRILKALWFRYQHDNMPTPEEWDRVGRVLTELEGRKKG